MQAKDVMTRNVVTTTPETPVQEVAELMMQHHISGVPVLSVAGALVGLVSEGDLLRRVEPERTPKASWWLTLFGSADAAKDFVKAKGRYVSDVMTKDVLTAAPDTELREIARLLEHHRIKRVPVVEDGLLVGIVSRANLLQGIAANPVPLQQPGTGDRDLRDAVLDALRDVPGVSTTHLNVVVTDGQVELWGYVHDEDEREALRVAAETVPGVKGVTLNVGRLPYGSYGI